MPEKIQLGVNVDHVATLRQARMTRYPDPLTAALIAERSPDAIRAGKKLINEAWEHIPAQALRQEAELQIAVMAGANQKEAVLANMEKRPPNFADPDV